jgi:hypothetical protein
MVRVSVISVLAAAARTERFTGTFHGLAGPSSEQEVISRHRQ